MHVILCAWSGIVCTPRLHDVMLQDTTQIILLQCLLGANQLQCPNSERWLFDMWGIIILELLYIWFRSKFDLADIQERLMSPGTVDVLRERTSLRVLFSIPVAVLPPVFQTMFKVSVKTLAYALCNACPLTVLYFAHQPSVRDVSITIL